MHLVGQEVISNMLSEAETFPQFMIFEGPKGQGKKFLALSLRNRFPMYVIPELKVDDVRKMVEDSLTLSEKKVYLIPDADDMTVQAQNALLKFCEEPSPNVIILMTVQHIDNVLSTIKSRAKVYRLQPYTKEQLSEFTKDESLLAVCENPGQILRAEAIEFQELLKTANMVVDNIGVISAANAFNIPKHFDIDNVDIFIQMLLYLFTQKMRKTTASERHAHLEAVRVVMRFKAQLQRKSINKANAVEMMFVEMREGVLSAK